MRAYSEDTIRRLTFTGRLVAAIIGFQRYCRHHAIAGPEIDQLIDHVWRYFLRYGSTEWELGFDQLALSPFNKKSVQAFTATIPESLRDEFQTLLSDTLWTHAFSWYGHDEEGSIEEFQRVLSVLQKYAIPLPDSALMLEKFSKEVHTERMTPDELARFRAAAEQSYVEM